MFMNKKSSNDYNDIKVASIVNITHTSIILCKEKDLLTVEATIKGKIGFVGICKIELILENGNEILQTYKALFFRGKLIKMVEMTKVIGIDSACFVKIYLGKRISQIAKVKVY